MPGTAYKVRVGAEGDSGFVSSEDVFETGPGEVHTMPVLAHAQRWSHWTLQLEMGASSAAMERPMNVFLWGPVGLGDGFLLSLALYIKWITELNKSSSNHILP